MKIFSGFTMGGIEGSGEDCLAFVKTGKRVIKIKW
jgi:hypothetical protein